MFGVAWLRPMLAPRRLECHGVRGAPGTTERDPQWRPILMKKTLE
jgi:hypothetical protein